MFHHIRCKRRGITRTEFLVVVGIVGLLICLLIPAIQAVREAARRAGCIGTLKMVGISLHNYHQVHGCFPPSMLERPVGNLLSASGPVPGSDNTNGGGADFSWRVMILPQMGDDYYYSKLDIANGFPYDGDPDRQSVMRIASVGRFSEASGPFQLCMSFAGSVWSKAPEYPSGMAALSNYVTLGATHIESLYRAETRPIGGSRHPNGTIYPGSRTSLRDIKDGASYTFLVCETREPNYAAWIDGTTAAVVGLAQQSRPTFQHFEDKAFFSPTDAVKTTINWGDNDTRKGRFYLDAGDHSGSQPWVHGPSSFHPGLVNHMLGDCSVRSMSDDIDPMVYMWLITRAGGEPVAEFFEY